MPSKCKALNSIFITMKTDSKTGRKGRKMGKREIERKKRKVKKETKREGSKCLTHEWGMSSKP